MKEKKKLEPIDKERNLMPSKGTGMNCTGTLYILQSVNDKRNKFKIISANLT